MYSSLREDNNHIELEEIRKFVELSLQNNPELSQRFNSINSINVPVNQDVLWELTRFKSKDDVYKNPNLSDIHTKSALLMESKKVQKKKIDPPPTMLTRQTKVPFLFYGSVPKPF
jgi:hypothetical protein